MKQLNVWDSMTDGELLEELAREYSLAEQRESTRLHAERIENPLDGVSVSPATVSRARRGVGHWDDAHWDERLDGSLIGEWPKVVFVKGRDGKVYPGPSFGWAALLTQYLHDQCGLSLSEIARAVGTTHVTIGRWATRATRYRFVTDEDSSSHDPV